MAVASAALDFSQGAVEELLECAICLGRLNDPRVLSCQHYFCRKCLQGCAGRSETKCKSLKCAICRKTTKLSFEGVNALPANYAVKGLLEMAKQRKPDAQDSSNYQSLPNGPVKEGIVKSRVAQIDRDTKNDATGGKKMPVNIRPKGKDVARVVAKTTTDENKNYRQAKKTTIVRVNLCPTSESSNDSTGGDTSSSDESDSETSQTSDYSDESSCSSLSDDSTDTDSESDEESGDESLPSASMAFGEMNIGSEVYVFSKVRKPTKGKLVHVKGYGRQLFAGIELEPGSRSWMKQQCEIVRGTSLHQWWTQKGNSARAIVHLDDCLPANVVEMMK